MPGWSVDHEQIVILYYNVQEACESGATVEEMEEAVLEDESHDCIEWSCVSDIKKWVNATRKAEQKCKKKKPNKQQK